MTPETAAALKAAQAVKGAYDAHEQAHLDRMQEIAQADAARGEALLLAEKARQRRRNVVLGLGVAGVLATVGGVGYVAWEVGTGAWNSFKDGERALTHAADSVAHTAKDVAGLPGKVWHAVFSSKHQATFNAKTTFKNLQPVHNVTFASGNAETTGNLDVTTIWGIGSCVLGLNCSTGHADSTRDEGVDLVLLDPKSSAIQEGEPQEKKDAKGNILRDAQGNVLGYTLTVEVPLENIKAARVDPGPKLVGKPHHRKPLIHVSDSLKHIVFNAALSVLTFGKHQDQAPATRLEMLDSQSDIRTELDCVNDSAAKGTATVFDDGIRNSEYNRFVDIANNPLKVLPHTVRDHVSDSEYAKIFTSTQELYATLADPSRTDIIIKYMMRNAAGKLVEGSLYDYKIPDIKNEQPLSGKDLASALDIPHAKTVKPTFTHTPCRLAPDSRRAVNKALARNPSIINAKK